jgi:rubrerythrin
MPITNRTLAPGTVLVATYKKIPHRCEVVATEAGLRYRYAGVDHKSPSTAASAVVQGNRNGWTFWSVEDGAAAEPSNPVANTSKSARTATTPKAFKQIKRTPNQKGAPEGMTRWHCSACMAGFTAATGETPETCPQGHPREVEDELATAD